ncbi:hypothetical protein EIP86_000631 [Pleurotus ostreatoroseus]|nr:hypothetical protein EIP86_000631 [Pleurotus ostreatoroseus]
MVQSPKIKLNSGAEIPAIGLGTWQSKPDDVVHAVEYALKEAGYRHIDCAWAYGNEKEVGEGIRRSGVPRSEIFITSKVWCTRQQDVEVALDETLANLGTDYLDLYLMHWPVCLNPKGNDPKFPTLPDGTRDVIRDWPVWKTWEQMEACVKKGKLRSIGVSNCSEKILEELLPHATIPPAVDQLELHLYNPQHELVAYLKSKGIVAQAYSPLGSTNSPLLTDEVVTEIAKKHGLSSADVLLGYLLAKDIVVLPKSVTSARIASNLNGTLAAVSKLTKQDIATLDQVAPGGKQKRLIMPPWGVDLGFRNWPEPFYYMSDVRSCIDVSDDFLDISIVDICDLIEKSTDDEPESPITNIVQQPSPIFLRRHRPGPTQAHRQARLRVFLASVGESAQRPFLPAHDDLLSLPGT